MARTRRESGAEQQLRLLRELRAIPDAKEGSAEWVLVFGEALEVLLSRTYDSAKALEELKATRGAPSKTNPSESPES